MEQNQKYSNDAMKKQTMFEFVSQIVDEMTNVTASLPGIEYPAKPAINSTPLTKLKTNGRNDILDTVLGKYMTNQDE